MVNAKLEIFNTKGGLLYTQGINDYEAGGFAYTTFNDGMIDSLRVVIDNPQEFSDGYHKVSELYYHRMILFATICQQNVERAWKSKLHDDGTMYDDYFIVGITLKDGSHFSYHYHIDHWDLFGVVELDRAPEWDLHTSDDVVKLLSL